MVKQMQKLPEMIEVKLNGSPDLVMKTYIVQKRTELTCLYLSTLVNKKLVDELVISGILTPYQTLEDKQEPMDWLLSAFKQAEIKKVNGLESCMKELLEGQCLVVPPGLDAVSIDVRQQEQRSVTEPDTEAVVRDPREGFVEDWPRNISLIRKRLKSEKLVIEMMTIGLPRPKIQKPFFFG
ncbi:spore germination protein [Paenibacillus sp. PL91]|uniref:spore germination protein n=1 Tax=Paenibacillus sp. PL91 TaxID=2729538 RepID=UPI00145D8EEE|nr:spore germination protein [Paenibacillus sp. PL91]MBC9204915.1 spore germination protein [Paenibacillus sp. PL91]